MTYDTVGTEHHIPIAGTTGTGEIASRPWEHNRDWVSLELRNVNGMNGRVALPRKALIAILDHHATLTSLIDAATEKAAEADED